MASIRKCCCYDAASKLCAAGFAEEKRNHTAGQEFGVSKKVFQDWCQAKETLLAIPKTKKVQWGKQLLNLAMETKLVEWITK